MTLTHDGAMTYAKMSRLVSFFSALLKRKKTIFSDLLHKMASCQPLYQHLDTQKILRPQTKPKMEDRDTVSSVHSQSSLIKPSDFDYLKVIGKGSFGKQQHVMVERSVLLKGLQHPFLVGLHFSFQTPNMLYFVVDYVNGGELFYHLQKEGSFPESRAAFYAAEMTMALGYLHSLDIVYRDLKPENILLDSKGHVRLTDFGLCKEGVAVGGIMHTFCGTPEYLAPEVLQGHTYSPAVDWWGLGSVLFEMLYGLPPFYSHSKEEMFEKILHAPLHMRSGVSEAACSLLEGLLERNVSKRLGERRDIVELQEHPFFASINWDDLLARKVTPPFVPNVTSPSDVSYIDPEFTLQPLPTSMTDREWFYGAAVYAEDKEYSSYESSRGCCHTSQFT
ncbi:serine/threonine-protein kinase Sgk2b isoform X2 [Dunckerocampus dactyliophorus]|uniref:serine/threonine-protein kinase Sgk2b isoform X2 n=1 Tax=Dunckerocampus dactyliophorus TaxID=161453 RepID=UPI00240504E9|nr:serine/threonine-protein kinase Sgk2b isoform X2 [Dunckerocampus dactyliophorus]